MYGPWAEPFWKQMRPVLVFQVEAYCPWIFFFFFLQWHFVISWKFKLSQITQNWPASKWTRIKFFTLGNSVISLDTLMTRSRKTSQDGGFTVKQGKKTLYTRSLSKVWTPSGWKSKQSARDFSWTGHLNRQQPHYKRSHSHINESLYHANQFT